MSTLEEVISKAVNNAVQKYMDVFLQIVSEKYQINQDELKELLCKKSSTPIAETDYAKFNIKQLRNLCKERNIKKTSSKKKGELIQLLEESDKAEESSMDVLVDDQTSSISSVSDSEPDIAPSQEDAGDSMSEAVDIPLDEVPAPENLPSIATPMVGETAPNTPMVGETAPNTPMVEET
ncbi:MAG: hypothetical protein CMM15_05730, partial [Rhodospirillaceae bacterium]|nr:hypothetical protein [Rhodospirillaceae bacterium]